MMSLAQHKENMLTTLDEEEQLNVFIVNCLCDSVFVGIDS